jgi:hypothetical protein
MKHHYMLWFVGVGALYVGVAIGLQAVVPSPETVDNPVFPQVCRVIMPEDLDR